MGQFCAGNRVNFQAELISKLQLTEKASYENLPKFVERSDGERVVHKLDIR